MRYDPDQHHRRSIRLKGYDDTQPGVYFVTIVIQGRECLLGTIVDGHVCLNDAGRTVQALGGQLPQRFPALDLDAYVVMPNHFHGIIVGASLVGAPNRAGTRPAPTPYG